MIRQLILGKKNTKDILKTIAIVVVIGILTQLFLSIVLTIVLGFFSEAEKEYGELLASMIKITPLVLLYVCVLAPIVEELVFRLTVLGVLKRFIPFVIANIIQALVFGIYHGNSVQGVYGFLSGLFIGYIFYISGGIAYTIILHMSINTLGMFLDFIVPEETPQIINYIVCVISAVGIISLTLYIKRHLCDVEKLN